MRSEYKIKPKCVFEIDKTYKIFSLLPTIIFQPWKYRWETCVVVDFTWLIFHIGFGIWERKQKYK